MDDETPEIVAEEELIETDLHPVEEAEEEIAEIEPAVDTHDIFADTKKKKSTDDDTTEEEDPEQSDEKEVEDYMFDALYGDR